MKELQECLDTRREIKKLNDKISEIKSVILSPKNQVITGMPRSGSNENVIEKYMMKVERLEKKRQRLIDYQQEQWDKAREKLQPIMDKELKYLLYLRFIQGLSWKKCITGMNKKYQNWTLNKAFRIYREINKNF